MSSGGPLSGVGVVELAGLGPAPFAAMLLADMGADVIRVDRLHSGGFDIGNTDLLNRGKRSMVVDLKTPAGRRIILELAERSDVLIEGYRPGVAERLGVGPEDCMTRNPGLVYGRMTGWGQTGPLSDRAGHDIDYIAVSGVLGAIGASERPIPPLNLVGDFGGGGLLLAFGVMAALHERAASGQGQVVDTAMVEGSALLATSHFGFVADGWWDTKRESNLLDGGAPFYTTYRTADDEHMAVGALEPKFFAELIRVLEVDFPAESQYDRSLWPTLHLLLVEKFASRTRREWESLFAGTDACVAPVLSLAEAPAHEHNRARGVFVEVDGVLQPAPAPRFSRTPTGHPGSPSQMGAQTDDVLAELGYSPDEISKLRETGSVA